MTQREVMLDTTRTILPVSEYHFTHDETENYKIFRVEFPFQTKKITFETINGNHMDIPHFMRYQSCAIIVNDKGNLKMKIPRSVINHFGHELSNIKGDTVDISIKENDTL